MKNTLKKLRIAAVLFSVILTASQAFGDNPQFLITQAHAHNDYEHTHPLFDALTNGFCSVEADISLVNGKLLVAHTPSETTPEKTLQRLYLDPLRERVKANGGRVYTNGPEFTLLIDLKQSWKVIYPVLHDTLTNYSDMLVTFRQTPSGGETKQSNAIIVIITGDRDENMFAGETIRYAAIDGQIDDLAKNPSPLLVPWISANWKKYFHWKGKGTMPPTELEYLQSVVKQAHEQGRLVRFWGAPDNLNTWQTLHTAGVDLINTDNLPGVANFFRNEVKN
ncbi:MAG TPA: phosphatidylinositol-specific phospholipase C/glycerophosphodiester phosphodiesterase family protein [Pseudomonadales bacterium]|nr:phosphatidylinositol-specific phospholipase C/glycerophosphodiester phosphodiesterase family protein [Pseudomonadales bacterium]